MTRLYDRVLAQRAFPAVYEAMLRAATVVVGTNVSDYYFAGTDQEVWDIHEDFPNVAPALDNMFVECTAPTQVVSREDGQYAWPEHSPHAWGVWLVANDALQNGTMSVEAAEVMLSERATQVQHIFRKMERLNPEKPADALGQLDENEARQVRGIAELAAMVRAMRTKGLPEGDELRTLINDGKGPRWGMQAILWIEGPSRTPKPIWTWQYGVMADGRMIRQPNAFVQGPLKTAWSPDMATEMEQVEAVANGLVKYLHTALLAVCFMHCKNVSSREVDPHAGKEALYKKKGARPILVRYHVLEIDSMKHVLRTEGQSETVGVKKALHICRGHFAHYTAEKPLFGRTTGTIWKSMHLRGSKKHGLVLKDYDVKATP